MPLYPTPVPASGTDTRANATASGDQYGSTITTLTDGGYVVAWAGSEAPGSGLYDIYIRRYAADGTTAGPDVKVNTNAPGSNTTATSFEHGPTVTGLAGGGFVVTWLGPGTSSPDVVAQRYNADGAPIGGEFTLSTSDSFHDLPTITALADGGFVATWIGVGTGGLGVRARRFGQDGTAAGDEFLVDGTASGDLGAPKATALKGGGFVLTWTSPGADGPDIFAQRFAANGAAVNGEFRVNTVVAGDQIRPAVTELADGGFLVTWVGKTNPSATSYDVFAQRFWADGSRNGGEFRVNTAAQADRNGAVDVTDLSDGGFLVSWSGRGADTVDAADVYAQRYLADGTAAGPEFRINGNPAGYEYGPSVVGLASGGFAVSWSDLTGANTPAADTDVYVQRFSFPAPVSAVAIAANAASQPEGNGGTTAFTFTVTLDTAVASAQSVQWQVVGAGARPANAADFAGGALPSGTLAFAANETSKTITVQVAGDALAEWPETFAVQLSAPSSGIGLANGTAVATIVDDEAVLFRGTEDGEDTFTGRAGVFAYEGLGKHDVLDLGGFGFRGTSVTAQPDGSVLITRGFDVHLVHGVEEVRFLDGRLAFAPYDPAAKVARLYEAALDRLPDQGGLNFWTKAVQNGEPLTGLANGFLASPEFQARFGGAALDNGAFVDRLYLNVLGRAGEAEGRAFWVNSLNSGAASKAEVLVAFSESAENQAGTAALLQNGIWDRSESAAEVARMYDTVFGRRPDAEGLTFWKNALDGGTASRDAMADAFAGSAEFQAKYGTLDNRGFANALYVNTLDRPADQAGLDFWTGALNNGATRAEVVLAFSESQEHVNLTAPAIGGEARGEYGILFA